MQSYIPVWKAHGSQPPSPRGEENPRTGAARSCNKMSGAVPSDRQITRLIERIFHSGYCSQRASETTRRREQSGEKKTRAKQPAACLGAIPDAYPTNFPRVSRAPKICVLSLRALLLRDRMNVLRTQNHRGEIFRLFFISLLVYPLSKDSPSFYPTLFVIDFRRSSAQHGGIRRCLCLRRPG